MGLTWPEKPNRSFPTAVPNPPQELHKLQQSTNDQPLPNHFKSGHNGTRIF